ncbi:serine hydrolase domain-containing protein [Mucilaginibacter gotjawali]|uniref:CubicO group peptidase (Beta-lactamase class C family) n=2 Tax=Mucilaginibacter gotjawali TaxID=1550579 RepID=A0A839SJJ7_9SPHI|nr:serine hydrolase [Mucilaginibacter gotjawali]MBB3058455.1 CubicO group peptidase (beta-lactamase class C family) [Mucilaginibacter gotjawali]BAU53716.1 Beta-lactamase [Mucilaginibacter gotjawali]
MKLSFYLYVFFLAFSLKVSAQGNPQKDWEELKDKTGWNMKRLDTLHSFLVDSTPVTGYMIIQRGKVVFQFGDVVENSYIASCRKSVLAMIYGAHVRSGEIKLDKTVKELGLDDVGGLLAVEKEASIRDIISARSGIYHLASYPGDFLSLAPKRGSVKHGTYWLYSNWDFNVAGYIFEKETGKNIYDEVERQLAIPLQMQDWKRSLQQKEGDSTRSVYPAYPMWFSTRDMARIGLLMLNKGKWGSQQLIDSKWVADMVSQKTNAAEINRNVPIFRKDPHQFGYGYLWWLWQNVSDKRLEGGYSAMGSMGQSITVFPAVDMVIVYKTKSDCERNTNFNATLKLLTYAAQSYN